MSAVAGPGRTQTAATRRAASQSTLEQSGSIGVRKRQSNAMPSHLTCCKQVALGRGWATAYGCQAPMEVRFDSVVWRRSTPAPALDRAYLYRRGAAPQSLWAEILAYERIEIPKPLQRIT